MVLLAMSRVSVLIVNLPVDVMVVIGVVVVSSTILIKNEIIIYLPLMYKHSIYHIQL